MLVFDRGQINPGETIYVLLVRWVQEKLSLGEGRPDNGLDRLGVSYFQVPITH
jgi:hypothetical protein